MKPKILNFDFLIHGKPHFENSSRAIPPGPGCEGGRLIIVTGDRGQGLILRRPLFNSFDKLDHSTPTATSEFPTGAPATRSVATDNQIVRLKDGSLLALKDTFVWDDIPAAQQPAWVKNGELVDGGGGMRKGQRGCPLLIRSTDCGDSWQFQSVIDFATILGGKYGYPQPHSDPAKKYWVGGCDRTELYACPFTGFAYLTTRVKSGPYQKDNTPARDTGLLFYSKDAGKSWELIKEDLPSWSPFVMTSTPDGRLFLFHVIGDQPTVYFSKQPVSAAAKPEMSAGHPVNFVENGKAVPSSWGTPAELFIQVNHPTVSRISTDATSSKVRAAYQGANADGMQVARVIGIEVQDPAKPPVVTPLATIQAEDPENASVMYFTFVEPDFVDMPAGVKTNASLLYWIEAPRTLSSRRRYAARYSVFEGESHTAPAHLSLSVGGAARSWSTQENIGDYMTGGFFWKDGALNYVAQWVEPEGIKVNIVTLPHPFFLSHAWALNCNGFAGLLLIDAVNPNGSITGRIIEGNRTDSISGFWDDEWDGGPGGARSLTFTRKIGGDPAATQIFTGYMMQGKPVLAGTFEAFAGTGATAKRSVYAWVAQPL